MQRDEWERRVADAWERFDDLEPAAFRALIEELAAAGPPAEALYERASAFDSLGQEEDAVALYEQALALGLGPDRRRQAVVQLASSLRNVGRHEDSLSLLEGELRQPSDDLDDAVRAFLALTLTSLGREREATATALEALAGHLPQYARSVRAYASDLRRGG